MKNSKNTILVESVFVEITNKCNYQCAYCYNKSSPESSQHIDLSEFKTVLSHLLPWGLKSVTLSGGEPFLYPFLEEIVEYALVIGLHVHIITNGSMMDTFWAQKVAKNDISIQLTMDAADKYCNSFTRGERAYDDTDRCIDYLSKVGALDKVTLRCNLGKHNRDQIEPMMQYCNKKRITSIQYALILPNGRGETFACIDKITEPHTIKDIKREIYTKEKEYKIYASTLDFNTNLFCPLCMDREVSWHFYMNCFGEMFPCQALLDKRYLIASECSEIEDDIVVRCQKIINYAMKESRELLQCKSCTYSHLCKGGCLADTERWGTDACISRKQVCREYVKEKLIKGRIGNGEK